MTKTEKWSEGLKFVQIFWKNGLLIGANFLDAYTETGIIKNVLTKRLLQGQPAFFLALTHSSIKQSSGGTNVEGG